MCFDKVRWHGLFGHNVAISHLFCDFVTWFDHLDRESVVEGLAVLMELLESLRVYGLIDDEKIDGALCSRLNPIDIWSATLIRLDILPSLLHLFEPIRGRHNLLRHKESLSVGQHVVHDWVCR